MLWSLEALFQQWPWGYQRHLKRMAFMLAKFHGELNKPEPSLPLIRGLLAQAIKVITQAALDHGNFDLAMCFWPYPDPSNPTDRDAVPPAMESADPFMGLGSPEELAAAMTFLRDSAGLAKARGERSKRTKGTWGDGGGGGGSNEEVPPKKKGEGKGK